MTDLKISIRVPATTANVGPAFDCMGIALNFYNYMQSELTDSGIQFAIAGVGAAKLPRNDKNIIYKAFAKTAALLDKKISGVNFYCDNNIPLNHGLGSSSAAIVSGIYSANLLLNGGLSRQEMIEIATKIEGHPDNVAPALLGGVTVSAQSSERVHSVRFLPNIALKFIVAIPEYEVPTRLARAALPKFIAHADGVFNAGHAALLTAALFSGDRASLAVALQDKLHQPQRAYLMPGMKQVFAAAKSSGAIGAVISGAGPTMLAIAEAHVDCEAIGRAMVSGFNEAGKAAYYKILSMDVDGASEL